MDCTIEGQKYLTAGRCSTHYWQYRAKLNRAKEKEKPTLQNSPVASKGPNPYFTYWLKYCHAECENCGAPVSRTDIDGLLAAQAHILPKSPNSGFPSVARVLENHMTLGARCGCHRAFDSSWEKAQKMKVWPVAVARFKGFMHLIDRSEVRRLPEPLRKIWDAWADG